MIRRLKHISLWSTLAVSLAGVVNTGVNNLSGRHAKRLALYFAGLFLGVITVCVAYFDSYIGQLTMFAAVAIGYSYYRQPDDAQTDTVINPL